jgi:hypothetical protein
MTVRMNSDNGVASGKVAEVVETSSTSFTAQCYALYGAPPLGGLVRVGDPPVYAVVHNVATAALDPGRRVIARGADEATEEGLYRGNPQLAQLLATHLEALVVGFDDGDALRHSLPTAPPRIHAFVYTCADDEVARFTDRLDFLRLVLRASVPAVDEVVAACLRLAAERHADPAGFLVRAGKAVAGELASDVGRLSAIVLGASRR